jgi:hypothetical protein
MRCVATDFYRLHHSKSHDDSSVQKCMDSANPVIRRYPHWNDREQIHSYGCQLVEPKVANGCLNDASRQLTC